MAFNWKAFATGFLEQTAEEIEKSSDRVEKYVEADYTNKLEEARKLREERRDRKNNVRKAVSTLKQFGITDDNLIANAIDQNGADGIIGIADALQTAVVDKGITINPETFIVGATDANLTIEDALKRLDGELKYIEADVPVRADGDKSFWERTFGGDLQEAALGRLERQFGEDYETLAAEVEESYTYEQPTGGVTIDWNQLRESKEIENLTPSEVRTAQSDFLDVIAGPMDLDVSWDNEKGEYVGKDAKTDRAQQAIMIASNATVLYDNLYSTYGNPAKARNEVVAYLSSRSYEENPPPPPGGAEDLTAEDYVLQRAADMKINTSNPNVKRSQLSALQSELRTKYGLNTEQINALLADYME